MDLIRNPYTPGAGTRPMELAGRGEIIVKVDIALQRIMAGRPEKSVLMVGLRGVGKTVLLNLLRDNALSHGMTTVMVEAPEGRSLPALLVPPMRAALLDLSRKAKTKELALKAMRTMGSFVKAMKLKFSDLEFSVDLGLEHGVADTGDLEHDLGALLRTIGEAAHDAKTAFILFIDELQYVKESDLAALITALHGCAQAGLPVSLVGAGLPQLVGNMGRAKSYAERLFDYPEVGKLSRADATEALTKPAAKEGAAFTDGALTLILERTQCYPYFLQEWGKHSWNIAASSPIQEDDVRQADTQAIAELDASFFRVRFDRCTPSEKQYLRAMADIGIGLIRSGGIASYLGKQTNQVAPVRSSLIKKGMIYSPSHGDTAYTVPLFADYMRRMMPSLPKHNGAA
jgi:AAA ATPase domain